MEILARLPRAIQEYIRELYDGLTHREWLGYCLFPQPSMTYLLRVPLCASVPYALPLPMHKWDRQGVPRIKQRGWQVGRFREAYFKQSAKDGRVFATGELRVDLADSNCQEIDGEEIEEFIRQFNLRRLI